MDNSATVLEGIRVLDLSRHISGPYCGQLLADMGAEVIRVEQPGGDQDRQIAYRVASGDGYAYVTRTRNKKDITLNLHSEEGMRIFRELVKRSDIVLENYSIEEKARFGLDYHTLSSINSRIVLVCVTAFGLDGPYAKRRGFDPVGQALSGGMSYNGFPGNPPTRSVVPWVDYATATHAALGAMYALFYREKTGRGQLVDVSLLDTAVAVVALQGIYAHAHHVGVEPKQMGNGSQFTYSDCFKAKDGWVFIFPARASIWRRFCKHVGREDLIEHPKFKTDLLRLQNRDELAEIVEPWVAAQTVEQVVQGMEEAGVPCAKVSTVGEAVQDPQIRHRGMMVEVESNGVGKTLVSGPVIKLSDTPGRIVRGAPLLGEHNEELYCGLLGFSKDDFERLKAQGVI